MFDLDGTLILSDRQLGQYKLLPHAVELLGELTRRGIPFLALTNGSAYPARIQAPRLAALGLPGLNSFVGEFMTLLGAWQLAPALALLGCACVQAADVPPGTQLAAEQAGLAAGGAGLRLLSLEGAVPVEGGIPLVVGGRIVGAIGASYEGTTAELLAACRARGVQFVRLDDCARELLAKRAVIPVCDQYCFTLGGFRQYSFMWR